MKDSSPSSLAKQTANPEYPAPMPAVSGQNPLKALSWILPVGWTLLILLSLWWNELHINQMALNLARSSARASSEKDLLYRHWAAEQGDLYVPVTDKTPPNPYLAGTPERDIATPSGRSLTRMNPAYMMRQVHEMSLEFDQPSGHFTSLKPVNPENAPDDWEKQSLEAFKRGAAEASSVEFVGNQRRLRFMRPLKMEASCLKCHAGEGYEEGDIRGGVSVVLPMKEYGVFALRQQRFEVLVHGGVWILGLMFLGAWWWQSRRHQRVYDLEHRALLENEEKFRSVSMSAQDGIILTDHEDRITFWNAAAETIFGYTKEEIIGKPLHRTLSPQRFFPDFSKAHPHFQETGEGAAVGKTLELVGVRKNGEEFPLEISLSSMKIKNRWNAIGVIRDITARKRLEQASLEHIKFLQKLMDSIPNPVFYKDHAGIYTGCNRAFETFFGMSQEKIVGKTAAGLFPPQSASLYQEKDAELFAVPGIQIYEEVVTDANGQLRDIIFSKATFTDVSGHVQGLIGVIIDITRYKQAENSLRESEEQFRTLFESSQDALMTLAPPSWRFTSSNLAARKIFGVKDNAEFISFGPWEVSPECQPDGRPSVEKAKEMIETAMREGSYFFEWMHKRAGGEEFPATVLLTRMELAGETILQATVRDITKEKGYEQQLMKDRDILEEKSKELRAALEEARRSHEGLSNLLADNSQVREQLEQSIKEVKKNQQMLLQSEKLASIGQLAAGIAHEINNPTGFIGSNLSTLDNYMADITKIFRVMETLKAAIKEGDMGKAQKIEKEVEELEKEADISYIFSDVDNLLRESKEGADRIGNIVRDLKLFSHTQEDVFVPSSLCKIMDGVINIVWNEIKYKAELKKDYAGDPLVTCNPQQIGQVFINMLVNASQAIKDKGVISVKTYESEGFARVEISDTGCGIPKENMNKIFDPFFTTKEPGKGTGLGLGISASIIKKHGGVIEVRSEVGRGTTFTISLPLNKMPGGTDGMEVR